MVSFLLVGDKDSHLDRMWARSSTKLNSWQAGDLHSLELDLDQWLIRASVLYLPEIIKHCILAIVTEYGDEPADVKIGWGEKSDIKLGLKNDSDGNSEAAERNFNSQ